MNRLARLSFRLSRVAVSTPRVIPSLVSFRRAASSGPALHTNFDTTISNYPTAHDLDPSDKSDYEKYVTYWRGHFEKVEDDFELERGLNHIFATDWVPSVEVIAEALRASRKLNTYATAVRILEALEGKAHGKDQYQNYLKELKPLLEELGVSDLKELGEFDFVREKKWHMQ
ncbi:cytochrome c oxidase, subunit VA/VI [Phlyctochytrium arcticum]|nr:cytochrome c oxidase, subunit VA/VI [Phlyctochytrium arcticum]